MSATDVLDDLDFTLKSVWQGSVFLLPSLIEVYNIYENSSTKVYHDSDVAIDGIYNNCTFETYHEVVTDYSFMALSILFLVIFSFLVKRISFKKNIFGSRPGLLLPMGMLDSHDHIVEFTLAFLSVSEDIYQFIFGFKSQFGQQLPIVKFIIKLAMVVLLSMTSYLTFAGLNNSYLVGYIFGLTLSACYSYQGIIGTLSNSHCTTGTKMIPLMAAFLPYCFIDISLFFIFLCRIINHLNKNGLKIKKIKPTLYSERQFCKRYVKLLFEDKQVDDIPQVKVKDTALEMFQCDKLKDRIAEKIYREIPDFSIPPRLIIGIFVGLYFAYRIVIDEIYNMTPVTWTFINMIDVKYASTKTNLSSAFKVITGNLSSFSISEVKNSYRHLTFFYVHLFIGCTLSAIIFGFVNSIIQSFLILRNYRLNFDRLTRKGFSSMISLKRAPSPYGLVLGFVRFSGYQAAYILWGILVAIVMVTVLLYSFIGMFLLPLLYVEDSLPRRFLINYGPVLLASILLNYVQSLIVKNVFVKQRGELMEIDNRRAFVICSHCVFFLNAMMGLFTSIKRMIIWAFSGIICFCRIDFSSLPDYLHGYDNGYMCYIGFLYTEQYHHNPILRYFANLLCEIKTEDYGQDDNAQSQKLLGENSQLYRIAKVNNVYRNKWRVAYTLQNNKSLIADRKNSSKR